MPESIPCDNLDNAIERYERLGYRLDMIVPADAPREALMSKGGEQIRLTQNSEQTASNEQPTTHHEQWIKGRAGMEYRDLIPGRLDGKMIASHIRLPIGGEVSDYVHYHKVDFQMIYCVRGSIKVVYEDQGSPFWLETGDCVLQPPEIRHRVLECTAGAEVIEITSPAVHETWVEHDVALPTGEVRPERDFGGQRFVRHIAALKTAGTRRDLGIAAATGGSYHAHVEPLHPDKDLPASCSNERECKFFFGVNDDEMLVVSRVNR